MISLTVGEPEQALFQDRVPLVPHRQRKTQSLLVIAEAPEPILTPPVGTGTRLVMGEIVPGVAVVAVVLPDRAPLPLAEVGAPLLPGEVRFARIVQPFLLSDIYDRVHDLPPLLSQMKSLLAVSRHFLRLWSYHSLPPIVSRSESI